VAERKKNMKRIVRKSKNFREAHLWDIRQQIGMTHEERQNIAKVLKERIYGKNSPDVRDSLNKS